jgi:hypothetical protein
MADATDLVTQLEYDRYTHIPFATGTIQTRLILTVFVSYR